MQRLTAAILSCVLSIAASQAAPQAPRQAATDTDRAEKPWVTQSNVYTNMLLDVQFEHTPEEGSREGLAKFDRSISKPTLADELAERRALEAVLAKLKAAQSTEKNKNVLEDLEILRKAFNLQFRLQHFGMQHEVPFRNASAGVFQGLRSLLDDQVAAERRPAAVERLRKYSGTEPGYTPLTEVLKQRELEQIAKPGVI